MLVDFEQEWGDWPQIVTVLSHFPTLRNFPFPYTLGSGTLINSQAVLTAAHVIYDPTYGGWADSFDIFFGDGSSQVGVPIGQARVRTEWVANNTVDSLSSVDAGVILLPQQSNLPFATPDVGDPSVLDGFPIDVLGFSGGDEAMCPPYGHLALAETTASNENTPSEDIFFRVGYSDFVCEGMSGGPVIRVDEFNNGTFRVRAVHTSLYPDVNGLGNGLMLYPDLLAQVQRWAVGLT